MWSNQNIAWHMVSPPWVANALITFILAIFIKDRK
jgi:hypothetical protein